MRFFGVIQFSSQKQHLDNSKRVKNEMWDTYLLLDKLLCYYSVLLSSQR